MCDAKFRIDPNPAGTEQMMIQGNNPKESQIIRAVYNAKQDHLFRWWDELDERSKNQLLKQLEKIDFCHLNKLKGCCLKRSQKDLLKQNLEPPEIIPIPKTETQKKVADEAKQIGEKYISCGKLGIIVVAGGQGTRLRYDGPKGCYPISPVKKKSLFQMHSEKILTESRAYGVAIPWYILTSESNEEATKLFFKQNRYFGLLSENVFFMKQQMLPALDETGKCVLDRKDHVFTSPDGHGGALLAMVESGALEDMERRGVKLLSYFQVDNPLIRIVDPIFIGYHIQKKAEMSSKMVRKKDPMEKVGHFIIVDGKLKVIEYSDMSREELQLRNPDGTLKFEAGSIGIHLINRDFVAQEVKKEPGLPFHVAHKKIPFLNDKGFSVHPGKPNGYKFEMFVFDALQDTTQSVIMEVLREEEFSPLKNLKGGTSPESVRRNISNYFGSWLESAGVTVPRDKQKNILGRIEISPFFARNREEWLNKCPPKIEFKESLYLGP
jgi:UDP-N-acetylglucosamine/UDP-N-acetylgalactosamine diphosphorylase